MNRTKIKRLISKKLKSHIRVKAETNEGAILADKLLKDIERMSLGEGLLAEVEWTDYPGRTWLGWAEQAKECARESGHNELITSVNAVSDASRVLTAKFYDMIRILEIIANRKLN